MKSSEVKYSQVKLSEVKYSQVKSSEVKYSQVKSSGVKYSQLKSSEGNGDSNDFGGDINARVKMRRCNPSLFLTNSIRIYREMF